MLESIKKMPGMVFGGHGVLGRLPGRVTLEKEIINDPMELIQAIAFSVREKEPGLSQSPFAWFLFVSAISLMVVGGVLAYLSHESAFHIVPWSAVPSIVIWLYIFSVLTLVLAAICVLAAIARPMRFGLKRYLIQTTLDLELKNRVLKVANPHTIRFANLTVAETLKEERGAAEALFPTKQGILAAGVAVLTLLFSQRVLAILQRNPDSWGLQDILLACLWAGGLGLICAGLAHFIGLRTLRRASRILGYALSEIASEKST